MKFVALDFETTGSIAGLPNEPWQLGLVEIIDGVVQPATQWETLFHVGDRPFSPRAVGRYAEMREQLAAAPTLEELWPEIYDRLVGVPLIAHNAATEHNVLSRLAPLTPFGPWYDTLKLARAAAPNLPSYSLGDLCDFFNLTPTLSQIFPSRTWHDALYDATACALLFAHLTP